MQRFALQRDRAAAIVLAVKLKVAQVKSFLLLYPSRGFGHLAAALAASVVDIVSPLASVGSAIFVGGVSGLPPFHQRFVCEVPLHCLRLRVRGQISRDLMF